MPNIPVTPVAVAPSPTMEAYIAPHAPPIHPAIKGLKYLKFTPNMAGSVIPKNAESEDGKLNPLSFLSEVFTPTARHAAPCAILHAEASGSQ